MASKVGKSKRAKSNVAAPKEKSLPPGESKNTESDATPKPASNLGAIAAYAAFAGSSEAVKLAQRIQEAKKEEPLNGAPVDATAPTFFIRPLSGKAASVSGLYADVKKAGEDSGVDLRFPEAFTMKPGELAMIPLDVYVTCAHGGKPQPFTLLPRSSLSKTPLIWSNAPGPRYAFTCYCALAPCVFLKNVGNSSYTVERGTALFQVAERQLRPARCIFSCEEAPPTAGSASAGQTALFLQRCRDGAIADANNRAGVVEILAWCDFKFAPGSTTDVPLGFRACWEDADGSPLAFWMDVAVAGYDTEPMLEDYGKGPRLTLRNGRGLIDRGYRGELLAKVYNAWSAPVSVAKGDVLCTLSAPGSIECRVAYVKPDSEKFATRATARGSGGFGSTGATGQK